jgi:hypothetical protein
MGHKLLFDLIAENTNVPKCFFRIFRFISLIKHLQIYVILFTIANSRKYKSASL